MGGDTGVGVILGWEGWEVILGWRGGGDTGVGVILGWG